MAETDFGALNDLRKRGWSLRVSRQGRDQNFHMSNWFMGANTDDMSRPVSRITELTETERGTECVLPLVQDLTGGGVVDDNELEKNEEALFALLRERLGGSRLFTVGIGSAPNSHFMTRAAQLGRGTFTYIGRIEEVGARMGELFAKLEAPVLKGLEVRWPQGVQVEAWPARLPDLYAGEPVVIAAALERLQGEVRLAGERDGRRWEAELALARTAPAEGMGSVWAREKVSALMASLRDGAAETEVRARVIELATAHRLVTRYTSFVAVDRTPARPSDAAMKTAAVPTLLPEGWEYDKVFGELPVGSTGSRLALALGSCLLLFGTGLLYKRRQR